MRDRFIIVASSSGADRSSDSHVRAIFSRWLGEEPPRLERITLDLLLDRLEHDPSDTPPLGVLVCTSAHESPRSLDRLVEGLLARNLPGLVLMPDPTQWASFQRHGVIFDAIDGDAGIHAALLFALTERQSCVELLSREVMLAQRCQGGISLEIDRIHDELHLAAGIQRDLVSAPLPSVPGLDLGVVFRPVNFVSGDIYSVRRLPDGSVGFLIADAVGHGVPAALLTMVITQALVTHEHEADGGVRILPPSEVLARLNKAMHDHLSDSGRFATAIYGVMNPATGQVTIAGAGHPSPLLLASGLARPITTDGPLLGIFGDALFEEARLTLAPSQTLLLYTDGLEAAFDTAPRGPGEKGCASRHMEHLLRLGVRGEDLALGSVLDELSRMIDLQCGSLHQGDDITVLAIAPSAAGSPGISRVVAA